MTSVSKTMCGLKSGKAIALLVSTLAAVFSAPAYSSGLSFSAAYDLYFQAYGESLLPQYDWRWLKAQCAAESGPGLDPTAVSPAGAAGVCQFMPGTWRDAEKGLRMIGVSRFNPRANIRAAAWLMNRYDNIWISGRPPLERLKLTQASYNAGPGNILKAQKLASGALLWFQISPFLVHVTGHHSRETIGYVQRIARYYDQILLEED